RCDCTRDRSSKDGWYSEFCVESRTTGDRQRGLFPRLLSRNRLCDSRDSAARHGSWSRWICDDRIVGGLSSVLRSSSRRIFDAFHLGQNLHKTRINRFRSKVQQAELRKARKIKSRATGKSNGLSSTLHPKHLFGGVRCDGARPGCRCEMADQPPRAPATHQAGSYRTTPWDRRRVSAFELSDFRVSDSGACEPGPNSVLHRR